MYIDKLLPFVKESDFVKNLIETVNVSDIYIPFSYEKVDGGAVSKSGKILNAFYIIPLDIIVMNESDKVSMDVLSGVYGDSVRLNLTYLDYSKIASRMSVDTEDDGSITASVRVLNGFDTRNNVATDVFINLASNGVSYTGTSTEKFSVEPDVGVSYKELEGINEESPFLGSLFQSEKSGNTVSAKEDKRKVDVTYKWLDSYFSTPESMTNSRETVPLLVGPTAVFKSATVKELCKKYNYRLVDFRVSFTSRLDYTGLINMARIDDKLFNYSCPMEEIVTCSDGFRDFCSKAYDKISEILDRGYLEDNKVSDGESVESNQVALTSEQESKLRELRKNYGEYKKTPVLFFDEITRCKDQGVNNVLVELLNKKKLDNMTLYGCKFVAATNANVMMDSEHQMLKDDLDDLYDVNDSIDVAYANRFQPIIVLPEDVKDRWFDWANSQTEKFGKTVTSIHPVILEFLNRNPRYTYNDSPVIETINQGLSQNEQRAQTFPNYRTWDMLSDYLYEVDYDYEQRLVNDQDAKREFKTKIVVGLISRWGADAFIPFLEKKGYEEYEVGHGKIDDEVGDFLNSSLEAGVPAMLIGPSSMGKTARVKAYIKRRKKETGLEPLLLDISLASKDAVDLMGMPKKQTLVEYVSGSGLNSAGLGSVGKELSDIMKEVTEAESYGMVDSMTIRAPSITYEKAFRKAMKEGREVILFFDECNRCTNPAVMSAMFEAISDYRFAGVSFKHYKHKVKIIGACNMAYDAMFSERSGGYEAAGSLDPALAARFSVFWKKRYDQYDVKSWISFMEDQKEEGKIDGILLDYIKEMADEDIDSVVQLIASVEDRTLIEAVPSTRALFELSKDIKNMRGKPGSGDFASSLYKGKVLFDDFVLQQNSKLRDILYDSSRSVENRAEELVRFLKDYILSFRDSWQVALEGTTVDMGEGRVMSGSDLMEVVSDISDILSDAIVKPMDESKREECEVWIKTATSILDTMQNLDGIVSDDRRSIFTTYVGEEFARNFTPYFDRAFGTVDDSDITIEMLSDDSLISPFFRKESATILSKFSGNTEKMVDHMIELMREFIDVHGTSLPAKNYADFIMGAYSTLPNSDNMVTLLRSGDSSVDAMLAEGEKMGDPWIMQILRCYPSNITVKDVDDMREALKDKEQVEPKKVSRSRIL